MRSDMHKVIVERPRINRSWAQPKKTSLRVPSATAVEQGDDFDGGPSRMPCSRTDKWFNEHLSPLERYLYKQVGRPWDKIYSEICAGIDRRSAIGLHVMQHVPDFVAVRVTMIDGVPYQVRRWGPQPVRRGLWVHPVTGLLLRVKPAKRQPQTVATEPEGWIRVSDSEWFENRDGLWFRLRMKTTDLGELVWNSGGQVVPAYFDLLDMKQCDRKTVRRIEAGEFGQPSAHEKRRAIERLRETARRQTRS